MSKQLVARANLLVFGVLIGFLVLMGALTWDGFSAARDARQWTEHTYQVLAKLRELGITVRDAETGRARLPADRETTPIWRPTSRR